MKEKKLLSARHPLLYRLAVKTHQLRRRGEWYFSSNRYAGLDHEIGTEYVVKRHSSLLLRKLGNVDMTLQQNKVKNLALAIPYLDELVIRPGEVFSFWRAVGEPSAERGYQQGLIIENGKGVSGVGGGMCQLANLLYWMALHSPLEIVEHHHHGYDVFPNSGRQVPFGSGAAVFYNYIDLSFRNPTNETYRIKVWLTDKDLKGELRADHLPALSYHIREEGHRFFRREGRIYRENYLYRRAVDRITGNMVKEELITHNLFPVLYEPDPRFQIEDEEDRVEVAEPQLALA